MKPKARLRVGKNNIKGNSMNPFIKSGCSLIIDVQLKKFSLGDILVFLAGGEIVAHRIIGIKSSRKRVGYTLKGDNHPRIDRIIYSDEIVGKVEKIIYPEYSIDLNSRKNQFLKYFFVLYSRLNLKFPLLLNLRKLYKIPFLKGLYRFLLKS